jgi:hypothetical protein
MRVAGRIIGAMAVLVMGPLLGIFIGMIAGALSLAPGYVDGARTGGRIPYHWVHAGWTLRFSGAVTRIGRADYPSRRCFVGQKGNFAVSFLEIAVSSFFVRDHFVFASTLQLQVEQ